MCITYEGITTWQKNWCSWELSCDGDGNSRPLGIFYGSKHLNCSGKKRFRHLLSIPGELLLTADQSRKSVLHRLALIMDRTFGHALSGIKNLREIRAKAVFFWRKGAFSRSIHQFWRYKRNKKVKKNTFHRFQSVKAKGGQPFTDCTILDIWAPFYHHGNGDVAALACPRYLKAVRRSAAPRPVRNPNWWAESKLPFSR